MGEPSSTCRVVIEAVFGVSANGQLLTVSPHRSPASPGTQPVARVSWSAAGPEGFQPKQPASPRAHTMGVGSRNLEAAGGRASAPCALVLGIRLARLSIRGPTVVRHGEYHVVLLPGGVGVHGILLVRFLPVAKAPAPAH